MPKEKVMWALLHIPSNTWDRGHCNLYLYWSEHEAKLACPNEYWRPVKVKVVEVEDVS